VASDEEMRFDQAVTYVAKFGLVPAMIPLGYHYLDLVCLSLVIFGECGGRTGFQFCPFERNLHSLSQNQ
jgi:hypothetical protein